MRRFLSAITALIQSLFGKRERSEKPNGAKGEDVDEIARAYYRDLLDSESKRKH